MSLSEKIRSNYETHGALWTLRWALRTKVNLDMVHFTLTGSYRKSPRLAA